MIKSLYLFIAIVLLFAPACKRVEKNVQNYIPATATISATAQPDGSVLVKGVVIKSGNTAIKYAGFCMDTFAAPEITTNQVFASTMNGDTFSCIYTSLNALKRYYFRAWVTNNENYATGKDVYIDSVSFDTSLIQCQLAPGSITFVAPYSITDHYTYITGITDPTNCDFTAYTSGGHNIGYTFAQTPLSGFYTSTDADEPGGNYVIVTFDGLRAKSGANIYVRQITNHLLEITICQLQVYYNYSPSYGAWVTMSTRFNVAD